jgi:hypothetical protein
MYAPSIFLGTGISVKDDKIVFEKFQRLV